MRTESKGHEGYCAEGTLIILGQSVLTFLVFFGDPWAMPSVGVQVPLDLEADSGASTSEDSDEDGWLAGVRMENTTEFYRPVHAMAAGGQFDGDSALSYFESRGFSRRGHTLAVGEDEAGPYFRLLEISSSSCKRRTLTWGRCFGAKKARTVDLTHDDSPELQPEPQCAPSLMPRILEIYDEVWTRPSLFRLEMPPWLVNLEPPVHGAELMAHTALRRGWVDSDTLNRMLQLLPGRAQPRNAQAATDTGMATAPKQFIAGAFVYGGQAGVMRNTLLYPWTCIALVSLANLLVAGRHYSSFSLSRNVLSRPHTDLNNDRSTLNIIVPLTRWSGGELWIEAPDGNSQLLPSGLRGKKLPITSPFLLFDGADLHATCPWEGMRLTLVLYHVRNSSWLTPGSDRLLRRFGFQLLPRGASKGSDCVET